jgi:hypothetical protein
LYRRKAVPLPPCRLQGGRGEYISYSFSTSALDRVSDQRHASAALFPRERAPQCGRAMAQVVSHRPLTAEALVRARVNPCGICGGQSGAGIDFSPSSSVFPSVSFHRRSLNSISFGGWTVCALVAAVQRRSLTPLKKGPHSNHWIGGWVGLRAGLDTEEARGKNYLALLGIDPLSPGRPVCSQTLLSDLPRGLPSLASEYRWSFPGGKRGRGLTLTIYPHLVPRSRMSRTCSSFAPCRLRGGSGTTLLFFVKVWNLVSVKARTPTGWWYLRTGCWGDI